MKPGHKQDKKKNVEETRKLKLSWQHAQVLLSKIAFELNFKFTERLYLSDVFPVECCMSEHRLF